MRTGLFRLSLQRFHVRSYNEPNRHDSVSKSNAISYSTTGYDFSDDVANDSPDSFPGGDSTGNNRDADICTYYIPCGVPESCKCCGYCSSSVDAYRVGVTLPSSSNSLHFSDKKIVPPDNSLYTSGHGSVREFVLGIIEVMI